MDNNTNSSLIFNNKMEIQEGKVDENKIDKPIVINSENTTTQLINNHKEGKNNIEKLDKILNETVNSNEIKTIENNVQVNENKMELDKNGIYINIKLIIIIIQ